MKVYLIGVGMGNPALLTVQAWETLRRCGLLIGAKRLLDAVPELTAPKCPLVRPSEIAETIRTSDAEEAAVLFSGDIGFFSGAKRLYPLLEGWEVEGIPGVSSLSYFAAKCQKPWQDAYVVSCHGRDGGTVAAVQSHAKTFLLTGGAYKVEILCRLLIEAGLGDLPAWAGEWLSYPQERIVHGTAAELAEERFDDLAVLLVENPAPVQRTCAAPGLPDSAFQRGKVPMTKEEVRTLAVSKLRPRRDSVIWDVGAGTGSVSVECALAASEGTVWAVERSAEGVRLLECNRERFGVSNLRIVEGIAPEALQSLPAPDRVFLGGSGGGLEGILDLIWAKNPKARVVLTAVTLETLSKLTDYLRARPRLSMELVQLSVARAEILGSHHLLRAENPIFLVTLEGEA